jgi:RNA polymerase sigma factor (TIGR02999 family)
MRRIPATGIKKSEAMAEGDVTRLLGAAGAGDRAALEQLYLQVYDELRRLAEARLRRERAGHTLQPTALVNEAYLRLSPDASGWENRRHFFGAAAQAMRRILVDHARQRLADKRDGGARVTLADLDIAAPEENLDVVAVSDALDVLAQEDPRLSEVVSLRFFAGMSVEETARALDVSPITIKRDWAFARAWLCERIGASGTPPA